MKNINKHFDTMGIMVDLSRNAVMSLDGWRRFLPIIAKMGYNAVFLYTEDTYEVEGEPFFGYMRGRYSIEELRALDELGAEHGIEMIPCIQTLGHLSQIFRWGEYNNDTPSTLLVGDERTYQLIDRMFSTLSSCFRTRRIHVGMDEAEDLGRGKYLDRNGYDTQNNIIRRHLRRVKELGDKYGLELFVWSDMFFKGWNRGSYYAEKCEIPEEYRSAVIDGVQPVYWDYYMSTEDRYDDMLHNHKQLSRELWFAGGIWTWIGFAPSNKYTLKTMTPAISACKKNGVRNVLFTLWGDAGAECSRFSVLPALYYVAELCRGNEDIERIKSDFKHNFGFDFDEFSLLDDPNRVAINPDVPFENSTTAKYMLYSDYFNGHYDFTVREGGGEYYRNLSQRLFEAKKNTGRYSYLFDTLAKLCVILSDKYELGVRTRAAYRAGDKKELFRLAKEEYTRIERAIPIFLSAFSRQWMKENKPYGFDVQEYRIGGLLARTKSCKRRLIDYVQGRVESIPELECEILPFAHYKRGFGSYINSHVTTFTSNVIDE